MSSLRLVENVDLDMKFLKDNLTTLDDIRMVNPSASLPFDENYWKNFYKLSDKSYSLFLTLDNEIIAHAALTSKVDDELRVFLCLVYLDKQFRGLGFSHQFLKKIEKFLIEKYSVDKYYLNVLIENNIAIKCYARFGFSEILRTDRDIRMCKKLVRN